MAHRLTTTILERLRTHQWGTKTWECQPLNKTGIRFGEYSIGKYVVVYRDGRISCIGKVLDVKPGEVVVQGIYYRAARTIKWERTDKILYEVPSIVGMIDFHEIKKKTMHGKKKRCRTTTSGDNGSRRYSKRKMTIRHPQDEIILGINAGSYTKVGYDLAYRVDSNWVRGKIISEMRKGIGKRFEIKYEDSKKSNDIFSGTAVKEILQAWLTALISKDNDVPMNCQW